MRLGIQGFHFEAITREALAHDAERAPGYEILTGAIKTGSRLAIWLSSRI